MPRPQIEIATVKNLDKRLRQHGERPEVIGSFEQKLEVLLEVTAPDSGGRGESVARINDEEPVRGRIIEEPQREGGAEWRPD